MNILQREMQLDVPIVGIVLPWQDRYLVQRDVRVDEFFRNEQFHRDHRNQMFCRERQMNGNIQYHCLLGKFN